MTHPVPTARARSLVAGSYDTHIHVAPDVMTRRITDVALARRFAELDAKFDVCFATIRESAAHTRNDILKWMVGLWLTSALAMAALLLR